MRIKTNLFVLAIAGVAVLGVALSTQKAQALPVDQVVGAFHASTTGQVNKGGPAAKGTAMRTVNSTKSSTKSNPMVSPVKTVSAQWSPTVTTPVKVQHNIQCYPVTSPYVPPHTTPNCVYSCYFGSFVAPVNSTKTNSSFPYKTINDIHGYPGPYLATQSYPATAFKTVSSIGAFNNVKAYVGSHVSQATYVTYQNIGSFQQPISRYQSFNGIQSFGSYNNFSWYNGFGCFSQPIGGGQYLPPGDIQMQYAK